MVAQLHGGHVIGNGQLTRRDGHHVGRRNEKKLGRGVDEARDEPGAGDAVDAGAFTGDPTTPPYRNGTMARPLPNTKPPPW